MKSTLGHEIFSDPYHIPVIRSALTKNLASRFPDIHDEIVQSFHDALNLEGDGTSKFGFNSPLTALISSLWTGWKLVPVNKTLLTIISRVSNRLFVGLPLCEHILLTGSNGSIHQFL